jgi:hypothetical protein
MKVNRQLNFRLERWMLTLNGSWSFSGLIQSMGAMQELAISGKSLRSS